MTLTLGDDGKEVTLHSASPSNNFIANSNSPSDLEIPDFDAIFSEGTHTLEPVCCKKRQKRVPDQLLV